MILDPYLKDLLIVLGPLIGFIVGFLSGWLIARNPEK